jgi:hypothetical protein
MRAHSPCRDTEKNNAKTQQEHTTMKDWRSEVMSVEELKQQSDDLQRLATNRLVTILARVTRKSPRYIKQRLEERP